MKNEKSITIHYTSFQSPMGKIHIGVTDKGLCCIAMSETSWYTYLEDTSKRTDIMLSQSDSRTDETKLKLLQYFEGKTTQFDIPVDLIAMTSFQKKFLLPPRK